MFWRWQVEELTAFSAEVGRIQQEYNSQTAQLRTSESETDNLRADIARHIQREADLERYVEDAKERLQQVPSLSNHTLLSRHTTTQSHIPQATTTKIAESKPMTPDVGRVHVCCCIDDCVCGWAGRRGCGGGSRCYC